MSEKTREILNEMTLEEKCKICAHSNGFLGAVPRLGMKGNEPLDNPRGGEDYFRSGRAVEGDGKYHPVAFPSDACLAMSWDEKLAYDTGVAFANECKANPNMVTWLFRPGMNLKRSVLCGRNFEYFSEDPVLTGELAGSYIQGLQDQGVAATAKHFICNNQEFERMITNSVVSERALREVYLKTFEIALKKGKPKSIMSSYNKVNGEWVNSNRHISKMLREELGYDGVVVSDAVAVHKNKAEAHQCGLMDVELAPDVIHTQELLEAVNAGTVREEDIDRSLERLLDLIDELEKTEPVEVNMEQLHDEARIVAEKCMVLLKNNGILPLSDKPGKLLIVGKLAEDPSYMGGGSGHMNGYRIDRYLDEVRKIVPEAEYEPGYELSEKYPPSEPAVPELIHNAVEAAKEADVVVVFAGLGCGYESEGYDRADIQLPEGQRVLLDELTKVHSNIILVLSCGSVLDIAKWDQKMSAILYNSMGGEAVSSATVNVIFGKAEPGGRLAESWPVYEEHTPAYLNFTRGMQKQESITYGEGIYIGYRWYEKRKLPVLYPFGHGLSYTDFSVGKPVVSERIMQDKGLITVTVPVTNTGSRSGSEVLGLYVRFKGASVVDRPEKVLVSFAKTWLHPGESKELCLTVKADELRFFDEAQDKWILEPGIYELMAATSAEQILYTEEIRVKSQDKLKVYTEMTPLSWYMGNEKFQRIMQENFPQNIANMMNLEVFPQMVLSLALPIYHLAEPVFGFQLMNPPDIELIIRKMNE